MFPTHASASARCSTLTLPVPLLQLNDIISLIIGLWAVVAAQKETTDEFTFGVRRNPRPPPHIPEGDR